MQIRLTLLSINITIITFLSSSLIIFADTSLFSDVPENTDNASAISMLKKNGIITGDSKTGLFAPERILNRAEFSKMIVKAKRWPIEEVSYRNIFPDIEENAWYTPYVLKANEEDVILGNEDGTFAPAREINLAEALAMILRAYKVEIPSPNPNETWYVPYIESGRINNIINDNTAEISFIGTGISRSKGAELIANAIIHFDPDRISNTPNEAIPLGTIQTPLGSLDSTQIDDIENALELVFLDALDDYSLASPEDEIHHYPPIDHNKIYMGVRNKRLYIKWVLGGNLPIKQEISEGNKITTIAYNIGVDTDNNTDNGLSGIETHIQVNINYGNNENIWITPWYNAKLIDLGEGNDSSTLINEEAVKYEKTGNGIFHSSNGGLGKNYFIISYSLDDFIGTIEIGQNINLDISSEAESDMYHHFSYDQNDDRWTPWTVKEI